MNPASRDFLFSATGTGTLLIAYLVTGEKALIIAIGVLPFALGIVTTTIEDAIPAIREARAARRRRMRADTRPHAAH